MGGSDVPSTTTARQELPPELQPYAQEIASRGLYLSNQPYQAYGGQRIADLSPESQAGLQMTTRRALQGNPALNAAQSSTAATASGAYLNPETNPYLSATVNRALNDVQGRVNSQFNTPGGYGGSAHQELLTRNLGEAAMQAYGQNYMTERGNQLKAAALAPTLAQQDYMDTQALTGVGDVYTGRAQDALNQQYESFLAQRQYPYQQLDVLGNALASATGNRSVNTQTAPPVQYNPAARAIGGGLLGYGAGSMLSGQLGENSPYIGAGLGALSSLYV